MKVASSYLDFSRLAGVDLKTDEHRPNPAALLEAAHRLAGRPVDLVAVDMPIARSEIVTRRPADNAVSGAYGGRKCGTHTPSSKRPRAISDALREKFRELGYELLTNEISGPGVIEVYPHPALVELTGTEERLPYKVSRVTHYWPTRSSAERKRLLLATWRTIMALNRSPVLLNVSKCLGTP